MKASKIECGAKTRAGHPCKAPAMKNGRCKLHGGLSTGAPQGNTNALKHGIYSKRIQAADLPMVEPIRATIGSIDDELLMVRLQLRRILREQAKADAATDDLEVEQVIGRDGGGESAVARKEVRYKQRDYTAMIDKLLARIASMETTRRELGITNTPDMPTSGSSIRR